ncbi:MAG: hypothetical protein V4629_03200 [Pseudomonadota bacterium]
MEFKSDIQDLDGNTYANHPDVHISRSRPKRTINDIIDYIVNRSIEKFEEEIKKKYDLKNELNE